MRDELHRVLRDFSFPAEMRSVDGHKFTGEEVFLFGLYRLKHPGKYKRKGIESHSCFFSLVVQNVASAKYTHEISSNRMHDLIILLRVHSMGKLEKRITSTCRLQTAWDNGTVAWTGIIFVLIQNNLKKVLSLCSIQCG